MSRWSPTVLPDERDPYAAALDAAVRGFSGSRDERGRRDEARRREEREEREYETRMVALGGRRTDEYNQDQLGRATERKAQPAAPSLTLLPGVGFVPTRTAISMTRPQQSQPAPDDPMAAEAKMRPAWARPATAGGFTFDPMEPMQRERYERDSATRDLAGLYGNALQNPTDPAARASLYARAPSLADNDPTLFPRTSGGLTLEQRQDLLDYTEELRRERDERRDALAAANAAQRNAARAIDAEIENTDKRVSVMMRRMDGERDTAALERYNRELAVLQDERTRLTGLFAAALRAGADAPPPRQAEPIPARRVPPAARSDSTRTRTPVRQRPGGPRPPPRVP